eukprot:gene16725-5214_t
MSFDALRHKAELRRGEQRGLELEAAELRRLLEDDSTTCAASSCTAQMWESPTSGPEFGWCLSAAKEECAQLRADAELFKQRSEKHARDYKYAHGSLRDERRRRQQRREDVEKLRTGHAATVAELT